MTGMRSEEQKLTRTFFGCASGGVKVQDNRSYVLTENGISEAESILSGLFGSQQGRVSYIMNPFFSTTSVEASLSGEYHEEENYVDCYGIPFYESITIPYSGTCPCYFPGLDGGNIFPADAEGLIYFYSVTQDRLTGCWLPGVYFPITYDIEAAWTDPSSQGPPPPSCRANCQPGDQCHDQGICNPSTGTCSAPKVLVGASCGGDYCTAAGKCDAQGSCVPGDPIPRCPEPDDDIQCPGVQCDPATGACIYAADGNTCSDGNLCTENDRCSQGKCQGTRKSCPQVECMSAQCNEWSGNCDIPLAKGENCSQDSVCEKCDGGGNCVFLTQVELDKSCDALINETIEMCKEESEKANAYDTWRVDAVATEGGGKDLINWIACAWQESKGLINTNEEPAYVCGSCATPLRKVTYISLGSDAQCARAKDETQGICQAVCSFCPQNP